MNSSVVMFPVSRNVEGPVGAGVIYSLMLEKAEWRRFIWLNMLMSFVWRFDTVDGEAADKQALACCKLQITSAIISELDGSLENCQIL